MVKYQAIMEEIANWENKEIEYKEKFCQTCPRELLTSTSRKIGRCGVCRGDSIGQNKGRRVYENITRNPALE